MMPSALIQAQATVTTTLDNDSTIYLTGTPQKKTSTDSLKFNDTVCVKQTNYGNTLVTENLILSGTEIGFSKTYPKSDTDDTLISSYRKVISCYHDNLPTSKYGFGAYISGGGLTVVGGGESPECFASRLGDMEIHNETERLYLISDNNIYFQTGWGCSGTEDTYDAVKEMVFTKTGVLVVDNVQSELTGNASTATKLAATKTVDGVKFDGSSNVVRYCVCSTAAATAAKAVTVTNFTLVTGAVVYVKFKVTNTAANPTLNVSGTGAKAIYYQGSNITASYLTANKVFAFVYNGTQYEIVGDIFFPIDSTSGLVLNSSGQLSIDFSEMSSSNINNALKSLKVPIQLTASKNFYVSQDTGSDTLDDGRGESLSKPFKTIQACINYVTRNYNINTYAIGIHLEPGVYEESLTCGEFLRTTGYIAIKNRTTDYAATIRCSNDTTIRVSGGLWYLRGLVIENTITAVNDGVAHFYGAVTCTSGDCHLDGCDITQEFVGDAPTSGSSYLRMIGCYGSRANLQFDATNKTQNKLTFHKGNATNLDVLFLERKGNMQCVATNNNPDYVRVHCEGEASNFLQSSNAYFSLVGGAKYLAQFVVDEGKSVTAKRYRLVNMSICTVANKGTEFFPGNVAGTLDANTYCVYA